MAAYVIVQVEISDWNKFKEYLKETPRVMAEYGGRYLARGGQTVMLEGDSPYPRVVLIEFPSLQAARNWYDSAEYQQIKTLRSGAATGTLMAVEGC